MGGCYPQGYTDCVEVYNPKTDTWRRETFLPERMADIKAETAAGKIYVVGLGKLLIFDPLTYSWEYGPSPLINRSYSGMATLQGEIYVFGGWGNSGMLDSIEVFDPLTNQWQLETTKLTFPPRNRLETVRVSDSIYIIGGAQYPDPAHPIHV